MGFQYKLHPEAQKEYEASVSWYLKLSLKAAKDFVNAVDIGLADICNNPNRYRNEYKNYRELSVRKFPFTIVYVIEENRQLIIIIAIYHQKRHPGNKYR